MTDMPLISMNHVFRSFGSHSVLAGVSWSVPAGSVVGVVGRNGCGKSTLLQTAVGLLRADGGSVRLLGEDARNLSSGAKARLGYVPQIPCLPPSLTVTTASRFYAALYPRWDQELVDGLVQRFEVPRTTRFSALSLGQVQSAALALALGPHPDLLILDEPAASLDPVARRAFHDAVLEIACDGRRTVVLSTHLISDLERLADRLLLLGQGRVLYDGSIDDLRASTKRLRIVAGRSLARPAWDGLLSWRPVDGGALAVVRDQVDSMAALARSSFGAEVVVEDLSLEDLVVEHQS